MPCVGWVSGCLLNSRRFAIFRDLSRRYADSRGLSADSFGGSEA
jgi:hypothetical protein